MRLYASSAVVLVLALLGYGGRVARSSSEAKHAPCGAIEALDLVFRRTQNLHGGVGIRSACHARRPGIPIFFRGGLSGVAYRSDTQMREDVLSTVKAVGSHPRFGRYALNGSWDGANLGTWIQDWKGKERSSEKDEYHNLPNGRSTLRVTTSAGLNLDLVFAADLSGQGAIVDSRSGAKATIRWDKEGDGTVAWANGAAATFEDWSF